MKPAGQFDNYAMSVVLDVWLCKAEVTTKGERGGAVWLHGRVAHHIFDACLIHRELRQMLLSGDVRRRHSGKLLLHLISGQIRRRLKLSKPAHERSLDD